MYCMITNLIRVIVIPLNQSNSCPNQLKSEMSYRLGVLQVRVTPERVVLKVRVLKSACCLVKYSAKDCDWERFYLCKRVVRDWSKSRSCRNWLVGDVDSCDSNKRIPTIKGDGVSSTT